MKKIFIIFLFAMTAISMTAKVAFGQQSPDKTTIQLKKLTGLKQQPVAMPELPTTQPESKALRDWTILASYPVPAYASGLAFDGTNLYCGIYGSNGDQIYQIDPQTGAYTALFSAPIEDAFGLTWDGSYLWSIDQGSSSSDLATAVQFDFSGNLLNQFTLQAHYMSGIAFDEGNFWTAAYYDPDGHLYLTDDEGNLITDFTAPDNQPWDLTVEGDHLWMADYWGDAIYKIDKATGTLLDTYASEGSDPSGIVWDGNFLWYIDNGTGTTDWLYKVDPYGSGAPVIAVPEDFHDFGLVNVGNSETWDMTIENNGAVDLTISGLDIPVATVTTDASFPVTIAPAGTAYLTLIFAPEDFGSLETTILIQSNDPLEPEYPVTLEGNGLFSGPTLESAALHHDFGNIRRNGSKRWLLSLENQGDEIVTINSVSSDNTHFYLDPSLTLPLNIPVLETAQIPVWFQPDNTVNFTGTLTIQSNSQGNSQIEITLAGTGEPSPEATGAVLWNYQISTGYDQSPIAFEYIPDLNADNASEIIVASDDNFIRCLNGNADGNAEALWETEIYSGSLFIQNNLMKGPDINADDIPDLFVGTTGGDRSVRALSGKDGSMLWQFDTHLYGQGGWVYQVFIKYDYNDDGIPDVLAATGDDAYDQGPKRIFCLDGTNGAIIWQELAGGPAFSVIGTPDFNGDGQPDVIAGTSNESESQGFVKGIDGATGNTEWTFTASGTSVWALSLLSDITGDNVREVVAGDFGGNYYFLNPVDGSYLAAGGIGNNLILRFEQSEDINGDGFTDVIASHSGTLLAMINGQTGNSIWTTSLADKCWNVRVMPDVTDDNINDLAVGTLFNNNYVYIIEGAEGSEYFSAAFSSALDGIGILPDVTLDNSYEMVAGGRNGTIMAFSGGTALVSELPDLVEAETGFHQARPNPFSENVTIDFYAENTSVVSVVVYDLTGRKVSTLLNRRLNRGIHEISWDGKTSAGSRAPSGIYMYSIQTRLNNRTGKIILK
jgi:hypothetical protein